jgi:hypothetical protein
MLTLGWSAEPQISGKTTGTVRMYHERFTLPMFLTNAWNGSGIYSLEISFKKC